MSKFWLLGCVAVGCYFCGPFNSKTQIIKIRVCGYGFRADMGRVMPVPETEPVPEPVSVHLPHTRLVSIFVTHSDYKRGGFGAGWSGLGITPIPNNSLIII